MCDNCVELQSELAMISSRCRFYREHYVQRSGDPNPPPSLNKKKKKNKKNKKKETTTTMKIEEDDEVSRLRALNQQLALRLSVQERELKERDQLLFYNQSADYSQRARISFYMRLLAELRQDERTKELMVRKIRELGLSQLMDEK